MVLPFAMTGGDDQAPQIVKDIHAKYWWSISGLFCVLFICDFLAGDVFDAIFAGILGLIVWYIVKDGCKHMSKYCLIVYGLCCVILGFFEALSLVASIHGRRVLTRDTVVDHEKVTEVTAYKSIQYHPFFDKGQGFHYNMQSVVRIISPLIMLSGGMMSYWSYSAWPSQALMPDFEAGALTVGQVRSHLDQQGQMYGSNLNSDWEVARGNGATRAGAAAAPPKPFEGRSHRLPDA
mmetsp:Transcript_81521/g.231004  ORF Transcript_81521/g.231004 Transcript_81521/m.231004 type:complete len:235 (-) Transcript_81521:72-776(-)